MNDDHATDIALLKFQQKMTTDSIASLASDVREMKEALLLNIASNKSLDVRHAEYDARFDKLTVQMEKMTEQTAAHQAFIDKVVGVLRVASWIGLPGLAALVIWAAKE